MMSPEIFIFPEKKSFCASASPLVMAMKSESNILMVQSALPTAPSRTVPFSLRSMVH